ncbi:MAG: cytochrome c [Proteobacteria bacterium]|nr:cytochrome c [Pseudomonadota bacterium]
MKIRRTFLVLATLALCVALSACKSCTDQHNPQAAREKLKQEETFANQSIEKLNPDGTVPSPKTAASTAAGGIGQEKFEQFCAPCHGVDGAASGPGALALNPHPRNFTDAKWQASVDDTRIAKVIKEGGASVGLSATMAPWGSSLSDAEIKEVVAWVRHFKK